MTSKKKYILAFISVIILFLIWYLFIKQNDYEINFNAKASPHTIYQGIEEWASNRKKETNEDYEIIKSEKYNFISFKLNNNNENLVYNWEIKSVNDSINAVKVGITDNNNSVLNRLIIPFYTNNFKKTELEKITDFKKALDDHISKFKIEKVKEGTSDETFVAYIHLKSVLQEKAQTMIMNDGIITGFLFNNKIKIIGKPYLEVTNLDLDTEILEFNYCFPIEKNDKIIENQDVKYKTIPVIKGLSVSYFGNMRTSDRGWFAIYDYAKKNNIELENKPLEHFFANPFNGGDELSWETQIIIPFKK
jgi:effector-binding domain-containing protein